MVSSLFLLLSVSFIAFTEGYNSPRHFFSLREKPLLHKRQENTDSACRSIAFAESCFNGQFQEKASISQRCNDTDEARRIQNGCMRNVDGKFCGKDAFLLRNSIRSACTSETSCSSECREVILNARRDLGCCVNIFNDTTLYYYYNNLPFTFSLWSRCDIEPVIQECQPSTVSLSAQLDTTCDMETLRLRLQSADCREEYVRSIRSRLLATEGCQDYTHLSMQECSARDEIYCSTLVPQFVPHNYTGARDSCRNTSVCESQCFQTLSNIISTTGCCFIDRYNSTHSKRKEWLSGEFWSRCGLTSPGFCQEYLNSSAKVEVLGMNILAAVIIGIALMLVF